MTNSLNKWYKLNAECFDEFDHLGPIHFQHFKTYGFAQEYIKDKNVIEVGCGSGQGAFLLSKSARTLIALDNNKESIEYAKKNYCRKNISYCLSSIEEYLPDKTFDCAISLQVIEHIKDPELYLEKIQGLVKGKGIAIFSTPNSVTQSYNENPYHYKEYSKKDLEDLLKKYFSKVEIFGLHGNKKVVSYEKRRKKKIMKILSFDRFNFRGIVPRKLKKVIFGFLAHLTRVSLETNINYAGKISEDDFFISENSKNSIDLIAICIK